MLKTHMPKCGGPSQSGGLKIWTHTVIIQLSDVTIQWIIAYHIVHLYIYIHVIWYDMIWYEMRWDEMRWYRYHWRMIRTRPHCAMWHPVLHSNGGQGLHFGVGQRQHWEVPRHQRMPAAASLTGYGIVGYRLGTDCVDWKWCKLGINIKSSKIWQ